MNDYSIDPSRVMVVGFSLGGRGAWFHSSRHTDIFKAAIVMAGSSGDEPIEKLATIPTYVIHSRDDEVVEFEPTEKAVKELKRLKRTIEFEPLVGPTHFTMGGYIDSLARGGRWVAEWKNRWTSAIRNLNLERECVRAIQILILIPITKRSGLPRERIPQNRRAEPDQPAFGIRSGFPSADRTPSPG
jgi:hypothetical protein